MIIFVDSILETLGEAAVPAVDISMNISSRGRSVQDIVSARTTNRDLNPSSTFPSTGVTNVQKKYFWATGQKFQN